MSELICYYNGFRERLIGDYEHGNARVEAALHFALAYLDDADTVLDVGCGIGWSSARMASTGRQVTGLDLSPVLIETARERFGDRCEFVCADFATWEPVSKFDAVVMIDVYEHFPLSARSMVHGQIRKIGARRVILAMPTPQAQQYARDNHIDLQPIDEDVTYSDLELLASDVGGRIHADRPDITIWRYRDYRHTVIVI